MAFITIKKTGEPSQPRGGALFDKKAPSGPQFDTGYAITELNNMGRRLRVLEERFTDLDRRTQVTDQNMLSHYKKQGDEIKQINDNILEIKSELELIKTRIREVITELKKAASSEDVKVLEKYINMWSPIKYVTHNEVEQIIREVIDRMRSEKE